MTRQPGRRRWVACAVMAACVGIAPGSRAEEASAVPASPWVTPAGTLPASPLSISTLEPGRFGVAAVAGFPWLAVTGLYGLVPGLDVGVQVRAAWSEVQRLNLQARWRFLPLGDGAFGLRVAAGTWMSRPASPVWLDYTGEQDYTLLGALAYSFVTPSNTLLTFEAAVLGIGTTRPRTDPLGGPPPAIGWGANTQLRVAAELPHESGLRLAFEVGLDLHTSGLDAALAMPFFGLGVGYVL